MLSTKPLKPLFLIVILGILAMTGMAQGAEKKRRKLVQWPNVPYLAFGPGQPLLFAAERGRSAFFLSCPELEVTRKIEAAPDRKPEIFKASPDGVWMGVFFGVSSLRSGGTLRVLKLATGETHLLLDDASRAFELMDNNRLIVWQPKGGITQWVLGEGEGKQVGPVITTATLVQVNISSNGFYLSPDGRYLLISGTCGTGVEGHSKWESWDFCLYDLNDGATLGWAENPIELTSHSATGRFTREFSELLVGTNVDPTGGGEQPACKKVGQNRELCSGARAVTLIETVVPAEGETPAPDSPGSADAPKEDRAPQRPAAGFEGIARELKERQKATAASAAERKAARVREAAANPRRALWTIRSGEEIGRFFNSSALSADGRWLALAVDGVRVLLFDTEQLQPNGEPTLVKQFEMP